jgi:type IV secretory pathway VirB6-like protein
MEEDRGDQKPLELAIKRIVSAKLLVKPRDNNGGSLLRLFLASSVSGAIHYGWGMQISILTPYAQVYFLSFLLGAFMIFADPFIIFTMARSFLEFHTCLLPLFAALDLWLEFW